MELLIAFIALWGVVALFAKISENSEKEKRVAEEAAERKRPQIFCSICRQPNKKQGDATCEVFSSAGPANIKICNICLRKYKFCKGCHNPVTQVFSIWEKGTFCKNCFEKEYRSFRDTRSAARTIHGSYCAICGKRKNLEVHHKTYAREGREHFSDLVVLCRSCHNIQHSKVHTGPRGGKYVFRKGRKTYINEKDFAYQPRPGDKRKNRE